VLLLGIVGVPWQDVADAASLTKPGLKLISEDGPLSSERLGIIYGNPTRARRCRRAIRFMFESPEEPHDTRNTARQPGGADRNARGFELDGSQSNHVNGHETIDARQQRPAVRLHLRVARNPITCDQAALSAGKACDCFTADSVFNRALCQPPAGGAAGITQYFGKGYPALRELGVLKGIGGHGIVASICPKTADLQSDSYGLPAAMDALAGRVANRLGAAA